MERLDASLELAGVAGFECMEYVEDAAVAEVAEGERCLGGGVFPGFHAIEKADLVMLMVEGDGTWRHNAVWGKFDFKYFSDSKIRFRLLQETHRWLWSSIGGDQKVRDVFGEELYSSAFERDFLRPQDFFTLGDAPQPGRWARSWLAGWSLGNNVQSIL